MTSPVKIAVTGAAGQICYSLLFRIASGSLLGQTPIELRLLEITPALKALDGVVMELQDCAFPNLVNVVTGDDPRKVFDGADLAFLVGAMPRKAGMERRDLLTANGQIFTAQGRALNEVAASDIKVLITGNPANTNALIAASNAPDIPRQRFAALTRLDHNRAKFQLATKLGVGVGEIKKMTIWGNHSSTQYPDVHYVEVNGTPVIDRIDQEWLTQTFIPTVAERGATVINARGASSAASAANATVECMHDWVTGTPEGDWVSMAVPTDGSYGIPEGVMCSFPCTTKDGEYAIVPGLEVNEFSRARIDASVAELFDERNAVIDLDLI